MKTHIATAMPTKNEINDSDEADDNVIFHPINPSPSEKQARTSPRMQLRKQRQTSYSHLKKYKDGFTNIMHHTMT